MADALITADALSKTFKVAHKDPGLRGTLRHLVNRRTKDIDAVKGVSFSVARGEVVGFLGANGAGKTTTLKMLSGLLFPTSGRCAVDGFEPFSRKHEFLRRITLVMGNKQQLLWDLPALDTLRMNAAIYGLTEDELKARTQELAGMLELEDKLTQPVRKLSLGERMKAELLSALLHRPSVLFLDEPTLGLDVNAQVAVRGFLKEYNRQTGATILLTSHYMQDIVALCPRVLVIHEGALIHDGTLDVLQQKFAPHKLVRLELHSDVAADVLARFDGKGAPTLDGRVATFSVDPRALTTTVQTMLAELPVKDLSVQDPPIEDVIGQVIGKKVEPHTAPDAEHKASEEHAP
jgi:ABC-2 type transport system ATP-binding protein